jgi:hypothetical protein
MFRTVLIGLGGFVVAIVAAAWLMPSRGVDQNGDDRDGIFLAARVSALESELVYERERRYELERDLYALSEQLQARLQLAGSDAGPARSAVTAERAANERETALPGELRERIVERFSGLAADPNAMRARQIERLVAAGISPDRAEWIERRTEELRMEALAARYDAARAGQPLDSIALPGTELTLRAELGDPDYERYLRATNRPTSIGVGRVLASSPAERAGLQPGDQIVSYGGERVFSMADLNAATLQGSAGQNVIVEVLRDGQPIQLSMPRGPVGIVGGRFRGR